MDDWRRRTAVIFALVLAVLLIAAPHRSRAGGFGLAPMFPSAVAGQRLEFQGTGFAPDELVSVWATAPDGSVLGGGRLHASEAGEARVSFELPFNAIGGNWAVTAWGHSTQSPVIARFDVTGRTPEQAPVQGFVTPASGPAGTVFSFTAIGYRGGEKVSYWITGPGNRLYEAFPEGAVAASDGRMTVSWSPPFGAPAGTFVLTAQGLKSGVARGIAFDLR
ncbi:MAG: hypothetical protein RLZZ387_3189 [Chloroflexota bacterium]